MVIITGEAVAIIGGVVAVLGSGAAIIFKFGRQDKTINSNEDGIKVLIDRMNTPGFVTIPMCTSRQSMCVTSVCKKVDKVEKAVANLHTTIEENEKIKARELTDIKHFMGRIEGLIEAGVFPTRVLGQKESENEETRG